MRDGQQEIGHADATERGSVAGAIAPQWQAASVRLFGVEIADTTLDDAAGWLITRARHGIRSSVAFLNAHCVNVMHRDVGYRAAVARMDVMFADGAGMRIAARVSGVRLSDNVNGTDLFPVLCREAARQQVGLFLLGARDGVARKAGECMQLACPGLEIAGARHGYFNGADDEARIIDEINASGAGVLLVALGVPAQERWIERNRARLTVPVVIGVGGLFDYYSGRIPRAPLMIRKVGFEWAWRLAQEPRRLAGRYIVGNVTFLARLAYDRLTAPADFMQRAPE